MAQINLDNKQIKRVKELSSVIANDVQSFVDQHTSTSVERTVLRLYGVDGVNEDKTPLPNHLIEILENKNVIQNGVSKYFAASMIESGRDAATTAKLIAEGKINFGNIDKISPADIKQKEDELAQTAVAKLDATRKRKNKK